MTRPDATAQLLPIATSTPLYAADTVEVSGARSSSVVGSSSDIFNRMQELRSRVTSRGRDVATGLLSSGEALRNAILSFRSSESLLPVASSDAPPGSIAAGGVERLVGLTKDIGAGGSAVARTHGDALMPALVVLCFFLLLVASNGARWVVASLAREFSTAMMFGPVLFGLTTLAFWIAAAAKLLIHVKASHETEVKRVVIDAWMSGGLVAARNIVMVNAPLALVLGLLAPERGMRAYLPLPTMWIMMRDVVFSSIIFLCLSIALSISMPKMRVFNDSHLFRLMRARMSPGAAAQASMFSNPLVHLAIGITYLIGPIVIGAHFITLTTWISCGLTFSAFSADVTGDVDALPMHTSRVCTSTSGETVRAWLSDKGSDRVVDEGLPVPCGEVSMFDVKTL